MDDVETSLPHNVEDLEHYGAKNVNPQKPFDYPFDNDILSDEETDKDKEKDESETWSKQREDKFWMRPPLLSEDLLDSIKWPVTMY